MENHNDHIEKINQTMNLLLELLNINDIECSTAINALMGLAAQLIAESQDEEFELNCIKTFCGLINHYGKE